QKTHPEIEVFKHREGGFEGILVAQIVGLLCHGQLRVAAAQDQGSPARPQQPGHEAQQGRFSRTVGAGDEECLAQPDRKAHTGKTLPATPDAGKVPCLKPHHTHAPRHPRVSCPNVSRPSVSCPSVSARCLAKKSLVKIMFTLLRSVDCLERREKRPYKPGLSAFISITARGRRDRRQWGDTGGILPRLSALRSDGKRPI